MKTTILTLAFSFMVLVMFGHNPVSKNNYLVTKDGKVIFTDIKTGLHKFSYNLENGEKATLSSDDVVSYRENGKTFDKKSYVESNKTSDKQVFMQLLTQKCGYKLYQFQQYESFVDKSTGIYHSGELVYHLYVFQDDKFIVEVDGKNMKNLFKFFNVKS